MNVTSAHLLLAAALSVALAGCGKGGGHGGSATANGVAGICTPFRIADAATVTPQANADLSLTVDECLHRWGYALAASKETADVVAAATVTACGTAISNWNQQSLSQTSQQPQEGASLTTGQPVDQLGAHAQFAQSQALFYVVQARAGKCAPPADRLLVRGG
jgi:hypothetical protein